MKRQDRESSRGQRVSQKRSGFEIWLEQTITSCQCMLVLFVRTVVGFEVGLVDAVFSVDRVVVKLEKEGEYVLIVKDYISPLESSELK